MKHILSRCRCIALALLACCLPVRADVYVVVHASNPTRLLTQSEALNLFMGRSHSFSTGEYAVSFDLPRNSAERALFYRALTGMSLAQVNSYWARLMFTGQTMPPQSVASEAEMVELVRRNPSAIGYLTHEPTDKGLKAVLVLKDGH